MNHDRTGTICVLLTILWGVLHICAGVHNLFRGAYNSYDTLSLCLTALYAGNLLLLHGLLTVPCDWYSVRRVGIYWIIAMEICLFVQVWDVWLDEIWSGAGALVLTMLAVTPVLPLLPVLERCPAPFLLTAGLCLLGGLFCRWIEKRRRIRTEESA